MGSRQRPPLAGCLLPQQTNAVNVSVINEVADGHPYMGQVSLCQAMLLVGSYIKWELQQSRKNRATEHYKYKLLGTG